MGQLTPQGYIGERLDEILDALDQGFRSIYGEDIDLAADSPDGQMIGLLAQIKVDLEELGEVIYRALDPDHASGAWLEQRVAYAGLTRRRASYSYLRDVIFSGHAGTRIPANARLRDSQQNRWLLINEVILDQEGSARVDLRSELLGAFAVPADTELTLETLVLGWDKAITRTAAELGTEEELDSELRGRFFRSRARPAQNSLDGIVANLLQLPDVREVVGLENTSDQVDDNGVPGHSLNLIVEGGDAQAIANTIFQRKTAGTGLLGATRVDIRDRQQITRSIYFDRPTIVECQAQLYVRRDANYQTVDSEAIKTALADTVFAIGQHVQLSRLYSPINKVPGFWVDQLKIARVGEPLHSDNIILAVRERARFSPMDIEVIIL